MATSTLTIIGTLVLSVLVGIVGLVAVIASEASGQGTPAVLASASVPLPSLVPVLLAAGNLCSGISAPLLAAQIDAESAWNPSAVSSAGAEGIAQFMPATFIAYSATNKAGTLSPFNPTDAIMAMGRYDCALLSGVASIPGDSASLVLAAYNAGLGAVRTANGIPAYPQTEAYVAKVEGLVARYSVALAQTVALAQGAAPMSFGQAVVQAAASELGVPYAWGGGTATGPSSGVGPGAATVGFDCSGLVLYAVAQASAGRVVLPHSSEIQATMGAAVVPADIVPGDVIAFALGANRAVFDHIGIYIGNNEMIDAPDTGSVVRVDTLTSYWRSAPSVIRSFG